MSPLQNVMVVTHQEQQQASGLTINDANTTEHATTKMEENRGGQWWKKPIAIIPNVGDDRRA